MVTNIENKVLFLALSSFILEICEILLFWKVSNSLLGIFHYINGNCLRESLILKAIFTPKIVELISNVWETFLTFFYVLQQIT